MNVLTTVTLVFHIPLETLYEGREEKKEENSNASLGRHEAKCFQTSANIALASFLQAGNNRTPQKTCR